MSFFLLLEGTQATENKFENKLSTPLKLNGDYEVSLAEFYISFFRRKLGELIIYDEGKLYKTSNISLPKNFDYFKKNIESNIQFWYYENNQLLSIECENDFSFDNNFLARLLMSLLK